MMKLTRFESVVCLLAMGAAGSILGPSGQVQGQAASPRSPGKLKGKGAHKAERWSEKEYPLGTGERLMNLDANEIEVMEIFRLERDGGRVKKKPTHLPLERRLVRALLRLCKTASKARPRRFGEPYDPNRAMVVKPARGEAFQIKYNSRFSEPFGGLDSPQLKEALCALAGYGTRCSVIHFREGKVLDVTRCRVPAIARGSEASQTWSASMDLDQQGRMVLSLKIRRNGKVLMEDAQPVRYGEATTFRHNGPGHMIVLLHMSRGAY